jgi:hypothetical protein
MPFNTPNDSIQHSENYGQKYYIGTVTANNDTVGIGRVQAQVDGLYNTHEGEVPFIGALKDSPFGFGKGPKGPYGVYGFPQVGSVIKVELQGGDENKALYTPLLTAPNAHPWFNVPSRWGFVDPAGNSLQIDMNSGAWTFTHQSGDSVAYDGSGNVVKVIKGNDTTNVAGSLTFQVTGNVNINCASFNVNASGTATYTASQHQFNGPVKTDSTIAAGGDITDLTNSGNTKTVGNMRTIYDSHKHVYYDDGNREETSVPIQQI